MKSIFAIFAIGLLLATAMSGCTGAENTNSIDTTTGTDTAFGNETGNETENETDGNITENTTPTELPIYTQNASGAIMADADGISGLLLEMEGFSDGGYYLTASESCEKVKLILNYTSVVGDLMLYLAGPDGSNIAMSETDGGGTESITMDKKLLKNFAGAELTLLTLGGIMWYQSPTIQASYTITVMSWGAQLEDFTSMVS